MTEVESFDISVGADTFTAVATCFFRDGSFLPLYIGRHTLTWWVPDFDRERISRAVMERRDGLIELAIAARSLGKKKLML